MIYIENQMMLLSKEKIDKWENLGLEDRKKLIRRELLSENILHGW